MAAAKAQDFAHRVVEFADADACAKFFEEKQIDFDRVDAGGSTVLMSVVARERVDLVGLVMDRTTNLEAATVSNGTTVLHLAAMASNPLVIKELAATDERKKKLRAIANACNRNGDTPLMMASVVKNAVAAKILVEYLDAFTAPKNSTGLTALMLASRLRDEREGPTMAAESATIVSLLLAYGTDVNAVESVGRQTALHFALLTKNVMVVEQLLTISDINLTARNKAGHSPVQLARKLKLDSLIDTALESQWQVVEEEANSLSEQVAQELANAVDPGKQQKKKKDKHKKKNSATPKKDSADKVVNTTISAIENNVDDKLTQDDVGSKPIEEFAAEVEVEALANPDDWVIASKKKPKRKDSIPIDPPRDSTKSPPPKQRSKPKSPPRLDPAPKSTAKPKLNLAAKAQAPQPPYKPQSAPTLASNANVGVMKPSVPAPWANSHALPAKTTAGPPPLPPHSLHDSKPFKEADPLPSGDESMSYEVMKAIFHRMFPIAEEMDIPVESFIAGADTRDARELLDGLSVSQVEMLQEAHLQAYHYLNERKIELARVLEGQRLQAQLELRRHLLEMP